MLKLSMLYDLSQKLFLQFMDVNLFMDLWIESKLLPDNV